MFLAFITSPLGFTPLQRSSFHGVAPHFRFLTYRNWFTFPNGRDCLADLVFLKFRQGANISLFTPVMEVLFFFFAIICNRTSRLLPAKEVFLNGPLCCSSALDYSKASHCHCGVHQDCIGLPSKTCHCPQYSFFWFSDVCQEVNTWAGIRNSSSSPVRCRWQLTILASWKIIQLVLPHNNNPSQHIFSAFKICPLSFAMFVFF